MISGWLFAEELADRRCVGTQLSRSTQRRNQVAGATTCANKARHRSEKRARQAMNRLSKEGKLTETIPVTQVKIVRSEWLPKQQRWQSDRPVVINVEKNRDPMTIDECASWLMQGVSARLVDLKETGRTVTLRNRSPLPISKCVVATGSDSETSDEIIAPEKSASIKLKTPASAIRAKISQLEFGADL